MQKTHLLLSNLLLLSGCATLVHQKTVAIKVYSNADPVKICVNRDTTRWYDTPVQIEVERSKKDLLITAQKDTGLTEFKVKSRLSNAFWYGNLFSGLGLIGYGIDLSNPKRFTYPYQIDLGRPPGSYTGKRPHVWSQPEKGLLTFKWSIPEGNHFYLHKGYGYGSRFGFLGISAGFEYYFTHKRCLSADFGVMADIPIPFPAPIDYRGDYEITHATYAALQMDHNYKKFHLDYGLGYFRTSFEKLETRDSFPDFVTSTQYSRQQNNLGFAFSGFYRVSNFFYLGLNYYPAFVNWDRKGLSAHYSHLLFFELSLRIDARRPKTRKSAPLKT